ncbi:MAG: hypothetical protein AAFX50_17830, partial [Acidobacteriota bacterium]
DGGAGPELYMAGTQVAGDQVTNGLARRVVDGWAPVVDGFGRRPAWNDGDSVSRLAAFDDGGGPGLYTAGATLDGGGGAGEVLRFDGADWAELPEITGDFTGLAAFDDGSGAALYAAGSLALPGTAGEVRLARFDGVVWTAMLTETELDGDVFTLEALADGFLYLGGDFTEVDGVAATAVARFDGLAWTGFRQLDTGFPPASVAAVELYDDGAGPALYITGSFGSSDGVGLNNLASWDPLAERWRQVGQGLPGFGRQLQSITAGGERSLYVLGNFTAVSGVSARTIARWNGSSWSAIPGGFDGPNGGFLTAISANPVAVDGPTLLMSGDIDTAGGLVSVGVAEFRFRPEIFADGFESGDASAWTVVQP